MDGPDDQFAGSDDQTALIVKGRRTKRLRLTSSASSGVSANGGENDFTSISSATTSGEIDDSTEEEEDMANCLILLAQGDGPPTRDVKGSVKREKEKFSSRRFNEMAISTTGGKAGFYVYECKTCNRTFPSFQALGGHRASHRKLKPAAPATLSTADKRVASFANPDEKEEENFNKNSPLFILIANKPLQSNKGNKVHECSICRLEFTSGQALGGHMRRHRAVSTVHEKEIIKERSNILSLDLNLPAPEDDLRETKFQFTAAQQSLVFSAAPALVDCHY